MNRTSLNANYLILILGIFFLTQTAFGTEPYVLPGNPKCSDLNLCANSYKIDPPSSGIYTLPDGTNTITIVSDGIYFDWSSAVEVCTVIVKGGDNANIYEFPSGSSSGTGFHAPINPNNNQPFGLSHIEFCYETPQIGNLEVTKTINWNGVTPDPSKKFDVCITGPSYPSGDCMSIGHGETVIWNDLIPGSYTITEPNVGTEWTVQIVGSPATVVASQTTQVSVTNTHKLGSLEVTKTINWNGETPDPSKKFDVCITGPSYPGGDCQSIGHGETATWNDLIPGSYTVSESGVGMEWTIQITASPAMVLAGQTAQASVTNTLSPSGTIIIKKYVKYECLCRCEDPPTFIFNGDINGSITHGEQIIVTNLPPGEYTVTEDPPGDWLVENITVDDNNSSFEISNNGKGTVTFRVEAGETVKAVFYNSRPPVLVSLSAGIGGMITSPGEGDFEYCTGETICLMAEATDPLYQFVGWRGSLFANIDPDCNDTPTMGWTNICDEISYGVIVPSCAGCFNLQLNHDHFIQAVFISSLDTLYVDDDGPNDPCPYNNIRSDPYENGTPEHPFDMIQEAIEVAKPGATIIVGKGRYWENIDIQGKCIAITSFDAEGSVDPHTYPIIEGLSEKGSGPVVRFKNCNSPHTSLTGFVITGGYGSVAGGIVCDNSSPTIQNCLIIGNRTSSHEGGGGAVYCIDSKPVFANCTIYGNYSDTTGAGIYSINSEATILDSIIYNNLPEEIISVGDPYPVVAYTDIAGGYPGDSNIDVEPQFELPGFWEHSLNPGLSVHPENPYAVWTHGDCHLKLESKCIDAGDPNTPYHEEPKPNGDRINMGAYGGTTQATTTK